MPYWVENEWRGAGASMFTKSLPVEHHQAWHLSHCLTILLNNMEAPGFAIPSKDHGEGATTATALTTCLHHTLSFRIPDTAPARQQIAH